MASPSTRTFISLLIFADLVAPTANVTNVSATRISTVNGKDSTDVTFTVDESCQAWKAKLVSSSSALHTEGTLIESGTTATTSSPVTFNITDAEFLAASAAEGTNVVKIFVQDDAGNWST